jgi:hypothetical protein
MNFGHFKQNFYSDRVVILNLTCRVLLCCVCVRVHACVRERLYYMVYKSDFGGTQWRSWWRHHATSRKVTGSIPVVVNVDIILPVALWPWG